MSSYSILGQEPFYRQLTEEDGLPDLTIYQIHQDKKGFIWFGTENGICRYDGKEMHTYYHPNLLDNEILTIQEDSKGRIWFKNLAGQLAFIEEGQLKIVKLEKKGVMLNFSIVDEFLVILWVGHVSRVLEKFPITKEGEMVASFQKDFQCQFNMSEIVSIGNKIYLYARLIGHQKIFIEFNIITDEVKFLPIEGDITPFKMMAKKDGNIILSGHKKSNHFNISSHRARQLKEEHHREIINDFLEEGKKELFFSSKGLTINTNDNTSITKTLLKGFKMNVALKDQEGNIWIGTKNKGVICIPSLEISHYLSANSKLPSDFCYSIYPYFNDKIMVGQDEGRLSLISPNDIEVVKMRASGRIRAINKDSFNRFWFGGDFFDLKVLNKDLGGNTEFKTTSGVKSITSIDSNSVLIGNNSQCLRYYLPPNQKNTTYKMEWSLPQKEANVYIDVEGKTLKQSGAQKVTITSLNAGRTYSAIQFQDVIWIGTTVGLYKYLDGESHPFWENNEHIPYSVSGIVASKDSTLWCSTQGHGVLGIKNDSVIYRLNETNGLATNNCSNLFYDEYHNLWVGSKKGLHRIDLNTFEINLINKFDGMPTDEISAIYAKDSIVWIGTQKGIVKMPYASIHPNQVPPPIYITNIAFWDKDTTLQSSYDLPHDQNNLNIKFVGLTYRNYGTTQYKYRMIGLDTNWVSTTTRFARYPILPPGDYEFQVKAINEDGVESSEFAKIQLMISFPWWQTWWFYFISLFGGIGLISFMYYQRIKQINERQEIDKKFNELRMMALQAQMNPHFVFNSLSAIQKFLTTNEQEQAMIYLARFAQLIRTIFEQSKEQLITLDEEFEFLQLYLDLEKLRFKDKVTIDFMIDSSIVKDDYDILIPPLIIQPIIENAFKHGLMHKEKGGQLKVEFSKDANFLTCKIEDNGVGRAMAKKMGEGKLKQGRSSGLKTAEERLEILNKSSEAKNVESLSIEDLVDENQNPIGTRVEIKIKYGS